LSYASALPEGIAVRF